MTEFLYQCVYTTCNDTTEFFVLFQQNICKYKYKFLLDDNLIIQPQEINIWNAWMNFLKVSIFFLYMKYITSILLLRKDISFQLRTILAFYFIMRIEVIIIYVKIVDVHATTNYVPSFNRRKNTSKACPIVRQTCQKSSVIKLSTLFSSKMHWKRVRVVPVRYNGDSFHWFWQPWVTPLLLGLPLVPAKLLLRLKFPAMNPAPKT